MCEHLSTAYKVKMTDGGGGVAPVDGAAVLEAVGDALGRWGREALRLGLPVGSHDTPNPHATRNTHHTHDMRRAPLASRSAWAERTLMRDVRMEPTGASVLRYLCHAKAGGEQRLESDRAEHSRSRLGVAGFVARYHLPQDGEADDVAENDKHEEVVQQAQAPILDLHDLHK